MNITSTILKLTQEDGTEIVLVRNTPDLIETTCNGIKHSYVLPIEHTELLAVLFGTESLDILNNILGAIYADQEKGWTLLNRGKAIAGIRFNINELIRGLSDRNCDSIIRQLETVEESLQKYRQILSIAQYRESIAEKAESLIEEHYDKKRTLQIQQLTVERDQLKKEIRRLDENLSENKKAIDYIDGLKLMIRLPDGKEICLKRDMVVGATDSLDLLAAKRRFKARKLQSILKELDSLKEEKQEDDEQLSLFKVESLAETFDKDIINVPIDSVRVKSVIDMLEEKRSELRLLLAEKTNSVNPVTQSMLNTVKAYMQELGDTDAESISWNYLFTSNLKELSGAVLHKTVFSFRLAYIKEIEKKLGISLPILLDSPKGKEIDDDNVQKMIRILVRDFSKNQIIIASIYHYVDDEYVIHMNGQLLDQLEAIN